MQRAANLLRRGVGPKEDAQPAGVPWAFAGLSITANSNRPARANGRLPQPPSDRKPVRQSPRIGAKRHATPAPPAAVATAEAGLATGPAFVAGDHAKLFCGTSGDKP